MTVAENFEHYEFTTGKLVQSVRKFSFMCGNCTETTESFTEKDCEDLKLRIRFEFDRVIQCINYFCAASLNSKSTNVFSATFRINASHKEAINNFLLVIDFNKQYNLGFEAQIECWKKAQELLDKAIESYNERFLVTVESRRLLTSQGLIK